MRIDTLSRIAFFCALGFALSLIVVPLRSPALCGLAILAAPLAVWFVIPAIRGVSHSLRSVTSRLTSWHWLILLTVVSGLTFRLRDVQDIDAAPVDGPALLRIAIEIAVAAILLVHTLNRRRPLQGAHFGGAMIPLALFALFCGVSAAWSVRPSWTLYKSLEYGLTVSLVAAILSAAPDGVDFNSLFDWVWTLVAIAIAAVWIGAALIPEEAFSYGQSGRFNIPELSGVWPLQSANSVGDLGAIVSIVALARLLQDRVRQRRRVYELALLLGITTMFLAQCRSAIAGFLLATLLLLILTRHTLQAFLLGTLSVAAGYLGGFTSSVWAYFLRSQQPKEFLSLSGRTDWWAAAWARIALRPLVGWGGFAGGRFLVIGDTDGLTSADIHSSLVETLLDSGVIGLSLLLLAFAVTGWTLWRAATNPQVDPRERNRCIECLAISGLLIVRSLFSTTLVAHSYPTLIFLLIAGYSVYVRRAFPPHVDARAVAVSP